MIKKIWFLLFISIFIPEISALTLSDITFERTATPTYLPPYPGCRYLDVPRGRWYVGVESSRVNWNGVFVSPVFPIDYFTIQSGNGFATSISVSGIGNGSTGWGLTGTDLTVLTTLTLDGKPFNLVGRTFGSSSNYLMNTSSPLITSGVGDYTVEFIYSKASVSVADYLCSQKNSSGFIVYQDLNGGNWRWNFADYINGSSRDTMTFTGTTYANQFIHFAHTYKASITTRRMAIKVGGFITSMAVSGTGNTLATSETSSSDTYSTGALQNFNWGAHAPDLTNSRNFNGTLYAYRISKGIARYQ